LNPPALICAFLPSPRLSSHVLLALSSVRALVSAVLRHAARRSVAHHRVDVQHGGPATIDRQRRRLLLSSAAALVGSIGLAGLSSDAAQAASQDGVQAAQPPNQPAAPASQPPIFSPTAPWLGTFSPNTVNMSSTTTSPTSVAGLPPGVRPREAWNAAAPTQPYTQQTPKEISLHHTGAPYYGKPGPEQYLRNIQAFHEGADREWEDIAYHYLIDLDGVVWAGRPPTVMGNPSIYYNAMNVVLICFMGDYDTQVPTDAQLAGAASTSAWLMKQFNITSPLTGHRDHAPTACPGDNLYSKLKDGTLTKLVQDSLAKV
jgi:N-acetylmuramoyl-L-alanine amidase-like protein